MRLRTAANAIALVLTAACANESAQPQNETVAVPPTASAPAAAAEAEAPAPAGAEMLVRELYREHDAQRSPFFQSETRELLDRYFEPALAESIWKDAVESKGEVGALGFDPLYDAQDVEPKNFIVHPAQAAAPSARVPVSFDSYGEKRQLAFVLVPVDGAWKISNIEYADGRTLRDAYAPAAAESR
jgi:hypothetical protein